MSGLGIGVIPTLRALLIEAGLPASYVRSLRWSDVLIVDNYGALPPAARADAVDVRYNGFDLVLLNRNGAPLHFCKCRPTSDDELAHETTVMELLRQDEEARRVIPETHGCSLQEFRIQVSAYVIGKRLEGLLPKLAADAWTGIVDDILVTMSRIAKRAEAHLSPLLDGPATLELWRVTEPNIRPLIEMGLEARDVSVLTDCVKSAGQIPRAFQHGDLWPGNIICHRGSWWVVDFARYGRDPIPMFDAYHLGRECCELREPRRMASAGGWLRFMETDEPSVLGTRRVLRQAFERSTLTQPQAIGALAAQLITLAARLMSRGTPFGGPFLREAQCLADGLRRGVRYSSLLFGVD